jgi:hypothetical protein
MNQYGENLYRLHHKEPPINHPHLEDRRQSRHQWGFVHVEPFWVWCFAALRCSLRALELALVVLHPSCWSRCAKLSTVQWD